jgi:hypothetical protein
VPLITKTFMPLASSEVIETRLTVKGAVIAGSVRAEFSTANPPSNQKTAKNAPTSTVLKTGAESLSNWRSMIATALKTRRAVTGRMTGALAFTRDGGGLSLSSWRGVCRLTTSNTASSTAWLWRASGTIRPRRGGSGTRISASCGVPASVVHCCRMRPARVARHCHH